MKKKTCNISVLRPNIKRKRPLKKLLLKKLNNKTFEFDSSNKFNFLRIYTGNNKANK